MTELLQTDIKSILNLLLLHLSSHHGRVLAAIKLLVEMNQNNVPCDTDEKIVKKNISSVKGLIYLGWGGTSSWVGMKSVQCSVEVLPLEIMIQLMWYRISCMFITSTVYNKCDLIIARVSKSSSSWYCGILQPVASEAGPL